MTPWERQGHAFRKAAAMAGSLAKQCENEARMCKAADPSWSEYQASEAARHRARAADHMEQAEWLSSRSTSSLEDAA